MNFFLFKESDGHSYTAVDVVTIKKNFYHRPDRYIKTIRISREAASTQLKVCEIAVYQLISGKYSTFLLLARQNYWMLIG